MPPSHLLHSATGLHFECLDTFSVTQMTLQNELIDYGVCVTWRIWLLLQCCIAPPSLINNMPVTSIQLS